MVTLRLGKLVVLAMLTAFLFWFFPQIEAPAGAVDLEPVAHGVDLRAR